MNKDFDAAFLTDNTTNIAFLTDNAMNKDSDAAFLADHTMKTIAAAFQLTMS